MKYAILPLFLFVVACGQGSHEQADGPTLEPEQVVADPLPSWNDGTTKEAVLEFVKRTTADGSADFIPVADRIAVFDNDGCLWSEAPMPPQLDFAMYDVKRRAEADPKLAKDPMVQAAISGDLRTLWAGEHHDGLMKILAITHSGMTVDSFNLRVREWMKQYQHPKGGAGLAGATFQPMLEVLDVLRAHGYKTFVVSGGGIDFMRVFSEELYGIPPDQVIGSSAAAEFEMKDGKPVLTKTMKDFFNDDKEGKPAGIQRHIGKRPVFCGGNSDGDQAMLEYTTIDNPLPSFGMIVHHTDSVRETAYDSKAPVSGTLITAKEAAPERGWVLVDMAKDWRVVFVE
ncbi:MAG: haloacid dehalogenase-like hydrolase [Flavobacteriales bacterium]|nr:haloacid dehalogenase-like hydrolase [Flavobacteriales bacterium]